MFGLSLHALLDGLAVAASVEADAHHSGEHATGLLGLGTFLAVALHTPLDAISITLLMGSSKDWTPRKRFLMVSLFSLMCPLGALIFWMGYRLTGGDASWLVGSCLAFSSGLFLCIALSDLLPEMEFHSHNRLQLSGALFAGILIAYMIGIVEPHHAHHHSSTKEQQTEVHDEDHDHAHTDHDHTDHDHTDHDHTDHDHTDHQSVEPSKPAQNSETK
jgi:zinc and cadmium transporter